MKRLLAKFGWALVRRFAPVQYQAYRSAIREAARQAVEQVSPSETPSFRRADPEWELDNQPYRPEDHNQQATTRG